jgi:hypothetical protein
MALWNQACPKFSASKGLNKIILLFNNFLLTSATAGSKVVSLPLQRKDQASIVKRDATDVPVKYSHAEGFYWLNATIGNPPQPVQLFPDTGSSDVWVFGPDSCDTGQCYGSHCKFPRWRNPPICTLIVDTQHVQDDESQSDTSS